MLWLRKGAVIQGDQLVMDLIAGDDFLSVRDQKGYAVAQLVEALCCKLRARIPMLSLEFFFYKIPSGFVINLESNKPLTDINIRNIFWRSRRMRWTGHVTRMGEDRGVHRVLVGKPEGKRPLGRPRCRWGDNIKMDLQEVGGGCGDWMELAQDRNRWRALVDMARDFRVP